MADFSRKRKLEEPSNVIPKVISSASVSFLKKYQEKFSQLIQFAVEDEVKEFHTRLQKWNSKLLQREGLSLFHLKGYITGYLFSEVLVKFEHTKDENDEKVPLEFHRFGSGDMVMLSPQGSKPEPENGIEGIVMEKAKFFIVVAVKTIPGDLKETVWRMDKSANTITYDRMLHAVKNFCENASFSFNEIALRDLIIGNHKGNPEALAAQTPDTRLSSLYERPPPPDYDTWNLNSSQRDAVKLALSRKLTLIQGPPGTGKTYTAVHIIRLITHYLRGQYKILCAADTNVAIDNLVEGLDKYGVSVLRLGRPSKIREEVRDLSIEAKMAAHPSSHTAERLRETIDKRMTGSKNVKPERDIGSLRSSLRTIEQTIVSQVISSVEVICATCIGCGHDLLANASFHVVVIDEATQATEPATLCALVKQAKHVIMLGDHFQLPPTVTSTRAEEGGMSLSLFQRLISEGVSSHMLQVQYRMHPVISEFPSKEFYQGRLTTGQSGAPSPHGFPWPDPSKPVAFIPSTRSVEETSYFGSAKSKSNLVEAKIVKKIVQIILAEGELKARDIGIVTPYSGQVKLIKDLLAEDNQKNNNNFQNNNNTNPEKIVVNTVDGFQGREKELIIVSTVRSNHKGKVGFLKDWRRMNVALTRAKRGLIVVGNPETLEHQPHWENWIEWIQTNKLISKPEFGFKDQDK